MAEGHSKPPQSSKQQLEEDGAIRIAMRSLLASHRNLQLVCAAVAPATIIGLCSLAAILTRELITGHLP